MKKLMALFTALALLLCLAVGASASVPSKPREFAYAYDYDGSVLSNSSMSVIANYGSALEDATGIQAIAVVVDFLDGQDPADYATDLINTWGIGQAGENNGVVVLLARGDRQIQIGTGRGIDRVMSGSKCGDLIDDNISYFADEEFDEGMVSLYKDVCQYLARRSSSLLPRPAQARREAAITMPAIPTAPAVRVMKVAVCLNSSSVLSSFTSSSASYSTRSRPNAAAV